MANGEPTVSKGRRTYGFTAAKNADVCVVRIDADRWMIGEVTSVNADGRVLEVGTKRIPPAAERRIQRRSSFKDSVNSMFGRTCETLMEAIELLRPHMTKGRPPDRPRGQEKDDGNRQP